MTEENSLLGQATMEEAYHRITELEEENRKLKDERDMLVLQQMGAVDHLDLLEKEIKKLNDLNSELRRINNKIMEQLEQKTRLVNYYRREKAED